MARRILSVASAFAVLGVVACQVAPIAIVDCRTTADCEGGTVCSPDHACILAPDTMEPPPPSIRTGDLITWDATGTVPDGSNEYEISGPWFLYDDCGAVLPQIANGAFDCPPDAPTKSCCTERDASLVGPPPLNDAGWTVTAGVPGESSGSACVRLTTAEHEIPSQWGAGLALNLNNWGAFDASRDHAGARIVGFSFDIESGSSADTTLLVGVGTTDNDSHYKPLTIPVGGAELFFDDLPFAYSDPPNDLDLTAITRINFAAPSTASAITYDFCVTNLHVLVADDSPSTNLPGTGGTTASP